MKNIIIVTYEDQGEVGYNRQDEHNICQWCERIWKDTVNTYVCLTNHKVALDIFNERLKEAREIVRMDSTAVIVVSSHENITRGVINGLFAGCRPFDEIEGMIIEFSEIVTTVITMGK